MNGRRNFLNNAIAALFLAGTIGTVTASETTQTYREIVSSVFASVDGKKLIAVTDKYHYIFDIPAPISAALTGSFHDFLQATFSKFRVDPSGHIVGKIVLTLIPPSDEVLNDALNAGFNKKNNLAEFETVLSGERYRVGSNLPSLNQYRLKKSYEIEVSSQQSYEDAHITPLTIVGGVLAVAGVAIFALGLIVICTLSGNLKNCHE